MPRSTTTKRTASPKPSTANERRSLAAFNKLIREEKKSSRNGSAKKAKSLRTRSSKAGRSKSNRPLFRDLDRDGVTYSFLSKFLCDREQARLSYVEGLTRDGITEALDFGTCYHELLEHHAKGRPCHPTALRKVLAEWLANQRKWRSLNSYNYGQLQNIADVVLTIFPIYLDFWKNHNGHEFRSDFVCSEEDFNVPEHIHVPGTPADKLRPIFLRGRFDAIFRLKGRLWLMENKTKSYVDEEGLSSSLHLDLQTMLYNRAIELKYGEKPEGVLYNVIRRPSIRQGKHESWNEYLGRVQTDIIARPSHYFPRWTVKLGNNDIDDWVKKSLHPILKQVCLWWDEIKKSPFDPFNNPDRLHHFFNPESLYNRYGRTEFFDYLTRNGSMHGLTQRSK